MMITVKLYAHFRQYLPEGTGAQGVQLNIDENDSINQVLQRLNVSSTRAHLVLINGVFVAPENRNEAIFRDHDVLAIWPQVAGG